MEHVLKATKETLQAGSQLTGLRAITSSTLLRAIRLAERLAEIKAHNWLQDCEAL